MTPMHAYAIDESSTRNEETEDQDMASAATIISFFSKKEESRTLDNLLELECACAVVERTKVNPFARFIQNAALPSNYGSHEVKEAAKEYFANHPEESDADMPSEGDLIEGNFSE